MVILSRVKATCIGIVEEKVQVKACYFMSFLSDFSFYNAPNHLNINKMTRL